MDAFESFPPPPPPRRRRIEWRMPEALRDPRRQVLVAAGVLLVVVLIVFVSWWANPTNRARRALAAANEHVLDKQREVIDARRMLAQRIAELRAARAEAQVQVTRYQAALDRATQPSELDSLTAAGDVLPSDTAGVAPSEPPAVTPPVRRP